MFFKLLLLHFNSTLHILRCDFCSWAYCNINAKRYIVQLY